ncbi:hypothetical protein [Jatrophihabitans sp.]|uniref:hypothetical protein n=1 Tax=Jatrophihabitans sp. TaxID=1932789 RepID=UPI0030C7247C|nr:hypothetical protein [Jatrophihabitans sp.]
MKASIETALRRLRAADPAAEQPVVTDSDTAGLDSMAASPSFSEAEFDRVLQAVHASALTLEAVPDSAVELSLAALIPPSRRVGGPRLQIAFAVAAVVLVAGVAVGVAAAHHQRSQHGVEGAPRPTAPRQSVTPPSQTQPNFVPGSTSDPKYAPALAKAKAALAVIPTLPNADPRGTAPVASLRYASSGEGLGNEIDKAAFWVAPGSADAAVAYFKAHPPAHMRLDGYTKQSGPGSASEESVSFADPSSELYYAFQIVPLDGGVAVRGDVQQVWYSTKPAAEIIGTVSSVDVLIDRANSGGNGMPKLPSVRRTLVGQPAQALASAVDAAKIAGEAAKTRFCPIDLGYTDRLAFHAGARTVTVVVEVAGCEGMRVTADGVKQPQLLGSVDRQALAALHLPASYGR